MSEASAQNPGSDGRLQLPGQGGARPAGLWSALLRPYRGMVVALLLCQIAQSLASLTLPSLSADVIDAGILANDTGHILVVGLLMLVAAIAQMGFSTTAVWLGARIAVSIGHDLRRDIFSHVQDFSLAEMRRFGAPSLITRTTNDVQQIQTMLVMVLTMFGLYTEVQVRVWLRGFFC